MSFIKNYLDFNVFFNRFDQILKSPVKEDTKETPRIAYAGPYENDDHPNALLETPERAQIVVYNNKFYAILEHKIDRELEKGDSEYVFANGIFASQAVTAPKISESILICFTKRILGLINFLRNEILASANTNKLECKAQLKKDLFKSGFITVLNETDFDLLKNIKNVFKNTRHPVFSNSIGNKDWQCPIKIWELVKDLFFNYLNEMEINVIESSHTIFDACIIDLTFSWKQMPTRAHPQYPPLSFPSSIKDLSPSLSELLIADVKELKPWQIKIYCNDGNTLTIHRDILCLQSAKLREALPKDCKEIFFPCDQATTQIFLDFLYTGKNSFERIKAKDTNIESLKMIADLYSIKTLSNYCENLIQNSSYLKEIFEQLGTEISVIPIEFSQTFSLTELFLKDLMDQESTNFSFFCNDGTRIGVHRDILCLKSEYFVKLFTSGMKEAITNEILIDTNRATVQALITFLYENKNPLKELNSDEIDYVALLHLAEQYQLLQLKQYILRFVGDLFKKQIMTNQPEELEMEAQAIAQYVEHFQDPYLKELYKCYCIRRGILNSDLKETNRTTIKHSLENEGSTPEDPKGKRPKYDPAEL